MSEDIFIAQLKQGNPKAFMQMVDLYQDKVYNTALGLVQNPHDAEDIAQEVFVIVFQKIHQFKGNATLSTWIYRITVHYTLDFLRRQKRRKRLGVLQQIFGKQGLEPEKELPVFLHPGIQLENSERAAILFAAIEKLPENQKTAFVLHKLEAMSYAEIALVLETSVSAVDSLLSRAKQNLKKLLADYYQNNEQ